MTFWSNDQHEVAWLFEKISKISSFTRFTANKLGRLLTLGGIFSTQRLKSSPTSCCIYFQRVENQKKPMWLCVGFTLDCSKCNGCITLKKVVFKYFINKNTHFRHGFFCSSMFTNKIITFFRTGYTGKYWPIVKDF